MTDYIHLSGTTPYDERCAQVGSDNYMILARMEAHAYIRQLTRSFGANPAGTKLILAHNPHDFGTYIDIRFFYDDEDKHQISYMALVECGCAEWDGTALAELKQGGYRLELDQPEDEESNDDWKDGYAYENGHTGHGDICMSDADPGL